MANQLTSPFDAAAVSRLRHMGLLMEDNRINAGVLEAVGRVHAGLLFDQLLDTCGGVEGTLSVCRRLIEQSKLVNERQVLLLLSIQYDAMAKPLPEVIWWISGNEALLTPFMSCFIQSLNALCESEMEEQDEQHGR